MKPQAARRYDRSTSRSAKFSSPPGRDGRVRVCHDRRMEDNAAPDSIASFHADLIELAAACHERGDPDACAELAAVRKVLLEEIA
jgi:hypothetical protein